MGRFYRVRTMIVTLKIVPKKLGSMVFPWHGHDVCYSLIYTKTGESRTDGGLLDILVMVLSFLLDQRPHLVMVFSFLLDQRPHVETPRPPNTTPGLLVKCVTADPGPDTVTMTS